MLYFEDLMNPFGPDYEVVPQSFPYSGWIITHKKTGYWIYTGGVYTKKFCFDKLKRFIYDYYNQIKDNTEDLRMETLSS